METGCQGGQGSPRAVAPGGWGNIHIKVHIYYVTPLKFKMTKNIVEYHIRNFSSMYCHGFFHSGTFVPTQGRVRFALRILVRNVIY